jgi:hypothetical protein
MWPLPNILLDSNFEVGYQHHIGKGEHSNHKKMFIFAMNASLRKKLKGAEEQQRDVSHFARFELGVGLGFVYGLGIGDWG